MSIAALIRDMAAAGATPEAIAIAVDAIEAVNAREAERKAKRARQKAEERAAGLRLNPDEWEIIRRRIFTRDNWSCRYCGASQEPLHCDHVIAVSRGGSHADDNLVTACAPCNLSKGSKSLAEWVR